MAGKALASAMKSELDDNPIKEFIANQKRKKMILNQGGGEYAAPVRYKIRQGTKEFKAKIKDVVGDVKDALAMGRAKQDASGPTSRNKSVGVCTAGGKCQN
jgi:hypothetical protein